MPETKYNRDTNRMDVYGVDLNRPVDSVKPGKFPYLKNMRSYQAGRIEPREGMLDLGEVVAGQAPVHSIRRLNDPFTSTFKRVIGTGTHLAMGISAPFTDRDSGYSGDPLALQPWKPNAAPNAYMYVADRLRMRKVNVAETLDTIGYRAPVNPPVIALTSPPSYKDVDSFDNVVEWSWVQTPSSGATTPSNITRTTTPIVAIVFDSGTTGWASVIPDNTQGIGHGEQLTYDLAGPHFEQRVVVHKLLPGSPPNPGANYVQPTTISGVVYESGLTGSCSVILTTPPSEMDVDSILHNITTGEYTRILAAIEGPDGTKSVRLNTTTAWNAGASVQLVASYRAYHNVTHSAGETVQTTASFTSITGAATGTLTKPAPSDQYTGSTPLDLSTISPGVPSRPDDYMHISFRVTSPQNISEIKILLDVDSSVNDFTRNFYYRAFRMSDLTPSVVNLETLIDTQATIATNEALSTNPTSLLTPLQRQQFRGADIDVIRSVAESNLQNTATNASTADSQQVETGQLTWLDVNIKLLDLIRVGGDTSRSLQNVMALRVQYTTTDSAAVAFDSWNINGGYGPDSGDATAVPYHYRYRVRNPATGVASNFSPATQYTVDPLRQSVTVTMVQYAPPAGTTLATTDFVLDINRYGGQIAEWHYVGTVNNTATPVFVDEVSDDVVGGNPIQANDNYEPWPILGVPVTGTTGNVAGTFVED